MADKERKDRNQTMVQKAVKIALVGIPIIMYVTWVYGIFKPCPRIACSGTLKPKKPKRQSIMCSMLSSLSKRHCKSGKSQIEKYEDPCVGFSHKNSKESHERMEMVKHGENKEKNIGRKSERIKCLTPSDKENSADKEIHQRKIQAYGKCHVQGSYHSEGKEDMHHYQHAKPVARRQEEENNVDIKNMKKNYEASKIVTEKGRNGDMKRANGQNEAKACSHPVPSTSSGSDKEASDEQQVDILTALDAFGEQLSQKYTKQLQKVFYETSSAQNQGKQTDKTSSERNCCESRGTPKGDIQENISPNTVRSQTTDNHTRTAENDQLMITTDEICTKKPEKPLTVNEKSDAICDQNFHCGNADTPYIVKDFKCDSTKKLKSKDDYKDEENNSSQFWHACNPPKGLKRGCQSQKGQEKD